jgi:hypothetical protein
MTLGSMRPARRPWFVTCRHCGHEHAADVDGWPDDAPCQFFGLRMRRSRSGKLGATAVPNCAAQR